MFTNLWTIKMSDWQRGFVVALLTLPVTIILSSVDKGELTFNWKLILAGAIAGGLGYIQKNFITGQNGNVLTNK